MRKGEKMSFVSRRKMSQAKKLFIAEGGKPWNYGKKMSVDFCRKIGNSKRGKKHPFYGKKRPKAFGRLLSKMFKGRPGTFNGRKHSKKTLRLMSAIKMGKNNPRWSKTISEETRKKKQAYRGERAPNWKGGIPPLIRLIRNNGQYKRWQRSCVKMYGRVCKKCKKTRGRLDFYHYPKSFSDIFHENKIISLEQALACSDFWDVRNGRILCWNCHRKTDTYGRNTKKYAS